MAHFDFDSLCTALKNMDFFLLRKSKQFTITETHYLIEHEFSSLHTVQLFFNAVEAMQRYNHQPIILNKLNHAVFLLKLSSVLNDYTSRNISLEVCDLANEIGMILGCAVPDKQALLHDFNHGFAHGVDLSDKMEQKNNHFYNPGLTSGG